MLVNEINKMIFEGDCVIDHLDNDNVREIASFQIHDKYLATVYMTDGGVMGLDEIDFNDITIQ